MPTILRRPLFIDDLRSVWTFIAADSEPQADRFLGELESRYRLLAEKPWIGAARLPHRPDIRLYPFGRYLVIYRPLETADGIERIRLLHAARDYRRFFDD